MTKDVIINTNIGSLCFEKPTKIYPGSLFDTINCPHCGNILDGQILINNQNKYTYIIKCTNCEFQETG